MPAGKIRRQALLGSGNATVGRLHLVKFTGKTASIRADAETYDLCPKNLDIYAQDLSERVSELKQQDFVFRTETHAEVSTPNGTQFREIHLPGRDDINIVLLEVIGKSMPFNQRKFYGVGPLIIIVPDVTAEKAFFAMWGLSKLAENVLAGPEVEKMVGSPASVSLDISIWGDPDEPRAEIEIISYVGAAGRDLYPSTRPPARGVLEVHYQIENLDDLATHLANEKIEYERVPARVTLAGRSQSLRLTSPAGQRIVVWG